jgi:hypothetical protein
LVKNRKFSLAIPEAALSMNIPSPYVSLRILALGLLAALLPPLLRLYLLMPFPGSQELDSLRIAYFLYEARYVFLTVGLVLTGWAGYRILATENRRRQVRFGLLVVLIPVVWMGTSLYAASNIFREPRSVKLVPPAGTGYPGHTLVLGVERAGEARAYPIKLLAYHHQVVDTLGGEPIIVTYCTMCRTGKIFSARLNDRTIRLDLIGAIQHNATFRDRSTGSWWRQATGEFVTGPLKGRSLPEVFSENVTLASWLRRYPNSLVMQPDTASAEGYELFEFPKFDWKRDTFTAGAGAEAAPKNWVVGLHDGPAARAYLWQTLVRERLVQDTFAGRPVLLALEPDTLSWHVWDRRVRQEALDFALDSIQGPLVDRQTQSSWDWAGQCTAGPLVGHRLVKLPASQEFWRSWQTFHPGSELHR